MSLFLRETLIYPVNLWSHIIIPICFISLVPNGSLQYFPKFRRRQGFQSRLGPGICCGGAIFNQNCSDRNFYLNNLSFSWKIWIFIFRTNVCAYSNHRAECIFFPSQEISGFSVTHTFILHTYIFGNIFSEYSFY